MPVTSVTNNSATIRVGNIDIDVVADQTGKQQITIRSNSGSKIAYGNPQSGFDVGSISRTATAAPAPTAAAATAETPKKTGFFGRLLAKIKAPFTSTPAAAAPIAAPAALATSVETPKKAGFFGRVAALAKAPFNWTDSVAASSPTLTKTLSYGGAATTGLSALGSGAFLANLLAPQAVHSLLVNVGMAGMLGPQSIAVVPAVGLGLLALFLGAQTISLFRAQGTPKA